MRRRAVGHVFNALPRRFCNTSVRVAVPKFTFLSSVYESCSRLFLLLGGNQSSPGSRRQNGGALERQMHGGQRRRR